MFGKEVWSKEDPLQRFNLDFNNPRSLRSYFNFANSVQNYGNFLGFEYGFDRLVSKYIIGDIFTPIQNVQGN